MKGPVVPCLWFNKEAEEAANFYVSVFSNSTIGHISRFGQEGFEIHHQPAGTVLAVEFTLNGQKFTAMNGGPQFKFNESVSFQIFCENQEEIDYYWDSLTGDGGQESMCGWLKDKYGLSWQVVPADLGRLMSDPLRIARVSAALYKMKKIDIRKLEQA
jgi:predicted 3-demethylubiquinone-9 3-methyltransferase (glyoxalase superfamily)